MSASGTRDSTIDAAKGLAIIAIVFGHVWRGLRSAGHIPDEALFTTVDTLTYMSHLTVFAFTAGLFVQRGMRRDGLWRYAWNRDAGFLWLYVLWSLIQGAVKLAAAGTVNSPTSVSRIAMLWLPEGQLWFFGWIAIMMVVAAATQPWRGRGCAAIVLGVAVAGSVAAWGLNGEIIGTLGLALTVYFLAAVLITGPRLLTLLARVPGTVWVAAGLGAAAVFLWLSLSGVATPPTIGGAGRTPLSVLAGVVASTAGLVLVMTVSRGLARGPAGAVLAFVGKQSLVVFVAHIVFASGTRAALDVAGVDALGLQVAAGTAVGTAGPLALFWVARRVRMAWLFEAPRWFVTATRADHAR